MKRPILPALLLLAAAGCATDDRPANVIFAGRIDDGSAPDGAGGLLVFSWIPGAGDHRIRVDGADLIWEMDDGWVYATFQEVGTGIGAWLPAGAHRLEIVTPGNDLVASTAVVIPSDPVAGELYTNTHVWLDASGAPATWSFVPEVDPDPDATRFEVRSTVAEPLTIERCVASTGDDPCEAIGELAARGSWQATLPVGPGSAEGIGEIYLQARLLGSPIAAYLGSTRPATCRQQGFFLPAEVATVTGPGATPDMREVVPQPTCL